MKQISILLDSKSSRLSTAVAVCVLAIMSFTGCATQEEMKSLFTNKEKKEVLNKKKFLRRSDNYISASLVDIKKISKGWLEYRFEIENHSNTSVGEFRGAVLSTEGESVRSARSFQELMDKPDYVTSTLVDTAVVGGGMVAAAMMGIPIIGLVATGGWLIWKRKKTGEKIDILQYWAANNLQSGHLVGNEKDTGSLFFPAVKATSINISYVVNDQLHTLTLSENGTESTSIVPSVGDDSEMDTIYAVQEALIAKGYSPGIADGVLGINTRLAIQAFQGDRGLPVSGAIDQQTLDALELVIATQNP